MQSPICYLMCFRRSTEYFLTFPNRPNRILSHVSPSHQPWIFPDGGFHKWGYPHIIHFSGMFPELNHPAIGGTPMTMETPIYFFGFSWCWNSHGMHSLMPQLRRSAAICFSQCLNEIWKGWHLKKKNMDFTITIAIASDYSYLRMTHQIF